MNRDLERRQEIERWIAWVRVFAVPFAVVEVGFLSHGFPPGYERWAWIATAALAVGAVVIWLLARRDLSSRSQNVFGACALAFDVAIVATNEVYFAAPDDYDAHDALLCIAEGRYVVEDDRRRLSREHFFKTADQMAEVFADLPEALANTVEIAKRCAFRPKGRKPILPRYVQAKPDVSETELLALETWLDEGT